MTELVQFYGYELLLGSLENLPRGRRLVAVVGPPGSGKSTLAAAVAAHLDSMRPGSAAVIPMDGFHYDNTVLEARGLRALKGSPASFDVDGLRHLLARLREGQEPETAIPLFDRAADLARAGAGIVPASARYLIVEGNYLLLNSPPWNDLARYFDLTVMLEVPRDTLEERLLGRWRGLGLSEDEARSKVEDNDLPNVDYTLSHSRAADLVLRPVSD